MKNCLRLPRKDRKTKLSLPVYTIEKKPAISHDDENYYVLFFFFVWITLFSSLNVYLHITGVGCIIDRSHLIKYDLHSEICLSIFSFRINQRGNVFALINRGYFYVIAIKSIWTLIFYACKHGYDAFISIIVVSETFPNVEKLIQDRSEIQFGRRNMSVGRIKIVTAVCDN